MTEKARERGEQNVYPLKIDGENDTVMIHFGMNLREYYAGLAMQGLLSAPNTANIPKENIAGMSTVYADALLEELSKDE